MPVKSSELIDSFGWLYFTVLDKSEMFYLKWEITIYAFDSKWIPEKESTNVLRLVAAQFKVKPLMKIKVSKMRPKNILIWFSLFLCFLFCFVYLLFEWSAATSLQQKCLNVSDFQCERKFFAAQKLFTEFDEFPHSIMKYLPKCPIFYIAWNWSFGYNFEHMVKEFDMSNKLWNCVPFTKNH